MVARSLLATVTTDAEALRAARACGLDASAWWRPSHRAIWLAACEALDEIGEVSVGQVRLRLADKYVPELVEVTLGGVVDAGCVGPYCDAVRRATAARRGADAAEQAAKDLRRHGVVGPTARRVFLAALDPPEVATPPPTWAELVAQAEAEPAQPVPTGLRALDTQLVGGWYPGDLALIAARPSVGKSMLALNVALRAAALGHRVAFASLEVAEAQVARNAIAACAGVDVAQLRAGKLAEASSARVAAIQPRLAELPMAVLDCPSPSLDGLVAQLEAQAAQLVVVDYLQLIRVPGYTGNRVGEVGVISGTLKALARRLGAPVVALSQLSRAVAQRGSDGRPRLSDLRDSGSLEQDADVVVLLRRPGLGDPSRTLRLVAEVAKHRAGPVGEVHLATWLASQLVADLPT